MEVLSDRKQTPRSLAGCQDLMQPVKRLVPQIISLQEIFFFPQELESKNKN